MDHRAGVRGRVHGERGFARRVPAMKGGLAARVDFDDVPGLQESQRRSLSCGQVSAFAETAA